MVYHGYESLDVNDISNGRGQWSINFYGLLEIFNAWVVPDMVTKAQDYKIGSDRRDMVCYHVNRYIISS